MSFTFFGLCALAIGVALAAPPAIVRTQTSHLPQCTTNSFNLLRNGGFENNTLGKPWKAEPRGSVTIVTDDPSNAFEGQNYAIFNFTVDGQLEYSATLIQHFEDRITPDLAYNLQFYAVQTGDLYEYNCTWSINLGGHVNTIPYDGLPPMAPFSYGAQPYYADPYISSFTATPRNSFVSFTLSCPAGSAGANPFVRLDYISLVPTYASCRFRMRISSTDEPSLNGTYIYLNSPDQIYNAAPTSDKKIANVFGIDGLGYLQTKNKTMPRSYAWMDDAPFSISFTTLDVFVVDGNRILWTINPSDNSVHAFVRDVQGFEKEATFLLCNATETVYGPAGLQVWGPDYLFEKANCPIVYVTAFPA